MLDNNSYYSPTREKIGGRGVEGGRGGDEG